MKYRLSALGWYNFESLCQTILKSVIGPGVSSFGGSVDGGRDATFLGSADFPSAADGWRGQWIFQAKHIDLDRTAVSQARKTLAGVAAAELKRLLARYPTPPDNYVLLTNVPLTAKNRDTINLAVTTDAAYRGNFHTIDGEEICQWLDTYPHVRRAFPQLLALADLEQIVNRDVYSRSEAYLRAWQPRLSTFVRTEVYERAFELLSKHHYIVLDGPPEAGKSTIAAALALWYSTTEYEIIDLRESNDFHRLVDRERAQLFIADDAVGSISVDPRRTDDWARDLPGILRKLDAGHLLVWTARKYVLEEALSTSRLGEATASFPGVHEVLVEVGDLSGEERAGILYNHAKQANLSAGDRDFVRANASRMVNHRDFTPERIRQVFEVALDDLRETGRAS